MSAKIKAIKEARADLVTKLKAMLDKAQVEKRELTAQEVTDFDAMKVQVEQRSAELARHETVGDFERTLGTPETRAGRQDITDVTTAAQFDAADLKGYSLLRAIRLRMNNQPLDGIEKEISDEISKRAGKSPQGFYTPLESRALTTSTGAGGLQNITSNSLIELLRAKTLVASLGATYLPNMVGTFKLPRQNAGATSYWLAESGSPTGSNATLDQVAFSPKTVGAFTDISRQFVNQTSLDAEGIVREDLAKVLAVAIDTAAFNGSGSSNQPTGILNTSGIGVVSLGTNGGAPTRASILALQKALETANVTGNYQFVSTPAFKAKAQTIDRGTDTGRYLWADDGSVEGYKATSSNLIPANLTKGSGTALSAAILGNFADLVVAFWGGLDILVDPYTGSSSGTVRIVAMQDCDIQLRHPESFAVLKDVVTT